MFYERILLEKYPKNAKNTLSALRGLNAVFNALIEVVALHFELAGAFNTAAKYVIRAIGIHATNYKYTKEVQLLRQMIRLVEKDSDCGVHVMELIIEGRSRSRASSSMGSTGDSINFNHLDKNGKVHNGERTSKISPPPPPLAVLYGRLGCGLLELGVLTDAENYLCLSLDTLNEYPDFTKTWINF